MIEKNTFFYEKKGSSNLLQKLNGKISRRIVASLMMLISTGAGASMNKNELNKNNFKNSGQHEVLSEKDKTTIEEYINQHGEEGVRAVSEILDQEFSYLTAEEISSAIKMVSQESTNFESSDGFSVIKEFKFKQGEKNINVAIIKLNDQGIDEFDRKYEKYSRTILDNSNWQAAMFFLSSYDGSSYEIYVILPGGVVESYASAEEAIEALARF